ncbi:MAG TPA: YtxH domain-containing protein [Candidatus Saccharimonadales bacterium]|nr:YtxH domain-containing protein [Candidatus Saccharimonadales bacterium]
MSKGKFAVGAMFGAVVGVVAGVLTAPKSGKETRDELKAKAEKAKAEVGKKAEYAASKANDISKEAKLKGQEVVDNVKTEAVDLKHRSERAYEGAKKGFFEKEKEKK